MKQVKLISPKTNIMLNKYTKLAATVSFTLLSACSILPSSPPVNIYQLPQTAFKQSTNAPTKNWSLRVNRPDSNIQINSQRIIVLPEPNLVSSYQGSRWNDTAPTIVRNRIIGGFITDGRVKSVSSDDKTLYADLELDSNLLSFQTEYISGAPQVIIRFEAQLVDANTRKVIANRRFEVTQTPTGVNVPQIVTAFGEASDKLNSQLIEWTISHADKR